MLPEKQGGTTSPMTNSRLGLADRRTSPRKPSNTENNNEFRASMSDVGAKHAKVCTNVCTVYQMQALTNDFVHCNQKAERES